MILLRTTDQCEWDLTSPKGDLLTIIRDSMYTDLHLVEFSTSYFIEVIRSGNSTGIRTENVYAMPIYSCVYYYQITPRSNEKIFLRDIT